MNSRSKTETALTQNGDTRQVWLDVARTLAIFCVTINHALMFSFAPESETYAEFCRMPVYASFLKAALYILSRLGVPLFLMISGALLLGRSYENRDVAKRFFKHNWWGLLRTTWIWLTIMFWALQASDGSVLRTEGVLAAIWRYLQTMLFINPTTFPNMWYMPMILCIYLLIPVIGIAIKRIDNRLFVGIIALGIFSSMILPTLNAFLTGISGGEFAVSSELKIQYLFSYYLFYVLIGYWIKEGKLEKIPSWTLWVGMAVVFFLTVSFQFWCYSRESLEYSIIYNDVGVLLSSAMAFELLRRKWRAKKRGSKLLAYLSGISFAIYFVHICVMQLGAKLIERMGWDSEFLRFAILEVLGVALSVAIIAVFSKIRILGKYVFAIKESGKKQA